MSDTQFFSLFVIIVGYGILNMIVTAIRGARIERLLKNLGAVEQNR